MLKSLKENRKGILLMICSSLCVCFGQLLWKIGVQNSAWLLFFGFALYAIGALVMLVAYKFGQLSVLQPMLSMNYIFALLLAITILNETVTPLKLIGILIITMSVILIGSDGN